ncbi:MAG: bacteriohemerythrin [Spirochaetaceae bacterium]|jgi:hemerythrin|nr:bacteriohemerythrin [Spirochaetaceae bacterium]
MPDNTKELVKWSQTFSVGIKIIDDQHRELLELTNDMFRHCVGEEKAEREYFEKVIHDAVDYVKIHFATEEKIMLKTGYAGYAEHKREHESFVLNVVEQIQAYNAGKPLVLNTFTRFLKEWILTHIAVSDKRYFEHFKRIATRKANGVLSISQNDIQKAVS